MRVPLTGAPYTERSLISSAQRCINLYAENNSSDNQAPVPVTYYPTPGSTLYAQAPLVRETRCTYRTSLGTAYVVIGPNVYFLASNRSLILIGTITDRQSQVYMSDNGLAVVIVDGVSGWVIDITTNDFAQIIDPSFYGADFTLFLDTFFVFNRPDTNQFYISLSMVNFALLSGTAIGTGTITTPGTLYTNGTYNNVSLTGGTGSGATADITISGASVTNVSILSIGVGYIVGDILSANSSDIGGTGSGFAYTIDTFALAFDPLDIAAKAGSADPIVGISTVHNELYLIGELTTEVWIGSGAADFYFQKQQGAYIDHGCIAQYSIASQDVSIFWIMQDKQGKAIVVRAAGYEISEISTPAIVQEFKSYVTLTDAIGFCFQIDGHPFYCLTFAQANKTWLYELKTGLWCEWNWMDENGNLNRSRANCCMFAYGENLIGDWETGILWKLDSTIYTDGNPDNILVPSPIPRIRTFPHMIRNGERINYVQFVADIECGTADSDLDPDLAETLLNLNLRWSDDRGKTFGNYVQQSFGLGGDYLKQPSWWRLGMARDRIFELSWSAPIKTALNGAFVEMSPSGYLTSMGRERGT